MKLTSTQLATIETYLLSWELQFRDFYDEMFDHFCSEIEQRISGGTSFENALAETSTMFDNYEFSTGRFLGSSELVFYNVKAMEMERFHVLRQNYQREFLQLVKRQVLSWRIVLWATLFVGLLGHAYLRFGGDYLQIEIFADGSFFGAFLLGFSLAAFLSFFSKVPLSETLFKRFLSLVRGKNLAIRKKYQFYNNARQHAFINLMIRISFFFAVIFQFYSVADMNMSIGFWSLLTCLILMTIYGFGRVFFKHRRKLIGVSIINY